MLCLMFAASAVLLVGCNGEGDENVNAFFAVAEVLYDNENVGIAESHVSWADGHPYQMKRQIFGNGNALFMPDRLAVIGQHEISNADIASQWESSVNSFRTGIDNFVEQCY